MASTPKKHSKAKGPPPQPKPLAASVYGRRRGVSGEAVAQAIHDGRLRESVIWVHGKPKIADADLADREWDTNTRARADTALPSPLTLARVRREQAAAEHAELELAQRRNEVISIADARRDVTEKFTIVKTRLLAVPSRVAQRLPHVASFVLPVLDELLREALEALSDGESL